LNEIKFQILKKRLGEKTCKIYYICTLYLESLRRLMNKERRCKLISTDDSVSPGRCIFNLVLSSLLDLSKNEVLLLWRYLYCLTTVIVYFGCV